MNFWVILTLVDILYLHVIVKYVQNIIQSRPCRYIIDEINWQDHIKDCDSDDIAMCVMAQHISAVQFHCI